MSNQKFIKNLKSQAYFLLNKYGIEDSFTLKIKEPKNSNWVASYRGFSQFKNAGRGPIFWLSKNILNNESECIISILHEYGHVIAEWAWLSKNDNLSSLLKKYWEGKQYNRPWDEEEFAEEFAQFVFGRYSYYSDQLLEVIKVYNEEMLLAGSAHRA